LSRRAPIPLFFIPFHCVLFIILESWMNTPFSMDNHHSSLTIENPSHYSSIRSRVGFSMEKGIVGSQAV